MLRINVHSTSSRRGFTLVELMVALSVSAIVLGGVLAAYLFVGRNLTRLVNLQSQDVQSRHTLRQFTQDLSAAINLTTASATTLTLTKPILGGNTTVTYTYNGGNATLTRTDSTGTQSIVTGLTAFNINYYNEAGTAVTSSPQSVKAVELSFASAVGSLNAGTLANLTTVSPRVVLRNKPALQ